jgi:serine/threonine protein kinase
LGKGTYGDVYLAKNVKDNNFYALKVLNKKRLIKKKNLKYAVG